jgi:hypothetical protein
MTASELEDDDAEEVPALAATPPPTPVDVGETGNADGLERDCACPTSGAYVVMAAGSMFAAAAAAVIKA